MTLIRRTEEEDAPGLDDPPLQVGDGLLALWCSGSGATRYLPREFIDGIVADPTLFSRLVDELQEELKMVHAWKFRKPV